MKIFFTVIICIIFFTGSFAQDTVKQQWYSLHFQETTITQDKPPFSASYSGKNSLSTLGETQTSITSTLFGDARLWKGADFVFDPELSGGSGLSKTTGIAAFPNGETFRVGSTEPAIYIARLYLRQTFEWGKEKDTITDDQNVIAGFRSKHYFTIAAGKYGLADFFDNNNFSHDPRMQFMNWALMDNGAYDYAANTRGYVLGLYTELGQPDWTLRFSLTMVTTTANGAVWDAKVLKANTQNIEYERRYTIGGQKGTVRVLGYLNNGKFGNYAEAIAQNPKAPNVDSTQAYGRHKVGFGISADQYITSDLGVFAKASYNDGHTETWFFTEIDRSVSFGAELKGTSWKRPDDEIGLAFIGDGLSSEHRDYLADGGYGFIIGDGKLNYAPEMVAEVYYKINAYQKKLWLTPDYQFILNPAYNTSRGPVNVFSLRMHVEF
ncbi:carbohydrate porin [Mucilaginibacter sp. E4BP6]|uniref:carbohydrate porin n=1 Tax=Mucilaginibacter sp. E4BP6 TaxID=2723089 RepID=UPI0015CE0906|nr:carbohydrate porin [Mucilaginibacter sp. E4BP6]NYE68085.1 high affinity Mn2+ porin [Mucilaginibacter sp. E4BP6]